MPQIKIDKNELSQEQFNTQVAIALAITALKRKDVKEAHRLLRAVTIKLKRTKSS